MLGVLVGCGQPAQAGIVLGLTWRAFCRTMTR